MLKRLLTLIILILMISALPFITEGARAKPMTHKDLVSFQKSQIYSGGNRRSKKQKNNKINQDFNKYFPRLEPSNTSLDIEGHGFSIGRILGHWSGRKTRDAFCNWLDLECSMKTIPENKYFTTSYLIKVFTFLLLSSVAVILSIKYNFLSLLKASFKRIDNLDIDDKELKQESPTDSSNSPEFTIEESKNLNSSSDKGIKEKI